jgi:integrator complex subunit 8
MAEFKCCMQLQNYTQAAVLCQFLNDVDYATAFKALQESRKRSDASELHYTDHIWDAQILEHAAHHHREAGEVGKKNIALSAVSRPQLNRHNLPAVSNRNKTFLKTRFLRTMALQYLC